jgi:hypothetical protein
MRKMFRCTSPLTRTTLPASYSDIDSRTSFKKPVRGAPHDGSPPDFLMIVVKREQGRRTLPLGVLAAWPIEGFLRLYELHWKLRADTRLRFASRQTGRAASRHPRRRRTMPQAVLSTPCPSNRKTDLLCRLELWHRKRHLVHDCRALNSLLASPVNVGPDPGKKFFRQLCPIRLYENSASIKANINPVQSKKAFSRFWCACNKRRCSVV